MTFSEALRNKFRFDKESPWHFYRKVVFWSFILSACITVPFVLVELFKTGSAVFLYYGDYNAQQICFYEHCIDMVRSGNFGWDWVTDLGSNFIGSYSYYMLGSPFFWMMCIFPSTWAPYLMAPMYMVKYIVAAVLGYAYLQRFVKNKNYAVIGGLLYAFSGFQIYNTFFNQFHDVVAFFPLLLIGMEELIMNNRRGLFALAVTLNALINYFMFAGQVVFCVIYFFVRLGSRNFRNGITLSRFGGLALEAVLGFVMAWFLFLPAASALMGNSRIEKSYLETIKLLFEHIGDGNGKEAFEQLKSLFIWEDNDQYYWQRYGQIFESYFFPPDIPSRVNFFYGHRDRWASISMYLPLFSMSGVFALFTVKKRTWLKVLVCILIVFSFVPVLNSMFFLFNPSYYARWLYMMILMFCLATIVALEDTRTNWKAPTFIMTVLCTLVTVGLGLIWNEDGEDGTTFGYAPFPWRFWIYVAIAFVSIALTAFIIRKYRGRKVFDRAVLIGVSVMTVVYACIHITNGKQHGENSKFMVDQVIEGTVELPDPSEEFYRIDQFRSSDAATIDNLGIYWNYPTMECFHTVVPPSIMNFYPKVNVTRSVGSRADSKYYGLRAFFSVKYSLIETRENVFEETRNIFNIETGKTTAVDFYTHDIDNKGFVYVDSRNGYDIYENENYIPMGFTYTEFMTESDFEESYKKSQRHYMLCKYLVVPDDMTDYYEQFMTRATPEKKAIASSVIFEQSVEERKEMCCDEFEYSSDGFRATITMDQPGIVYFSVPYEENGWSAAVNGEEKDVLKVTYGFVAVECEEGYNEIVFDYSTPGLAVPCVITLDESEFEMPAGIWWSLGALAIFVIYMLYFKVLKKHKAETGFFSFDFYDDCDAFIECAKTDQPTEAHESEAPSCVDDEPIE